MVRFAVTGGRIRSGAGVELLGVLFDSIVGTDGSVLAPFGAPDTVLLRARSPGLAVVDVGCGHPFPSPVTRSVIVCIEL